jgi:hypothetical protein
MAFIVILGFLSACCFVGFFGSLLSGECSFSEIDGRKRLLGCLIGGVLLGLATVGLFLIRNEL